MSLHAHGVVWIDHHEARIIRFTRDDVAEKTVHPAHAAHHLHSHAGSHDGDKAREDPAFFQEIGESLAGVQSLLVGGPANAKTEFVKHLHRHFPDLAKRVAGVEPMDHMSEGELLAVARHFFKKADREMPHGA